jgi:hypothetical protein
MRDTPDNCAQHGKRGLLECQGLRLPLPVEVPFPTEVGQLVSDDTQIHHDGPLSLVLEYARCFPFSLLASRACWVGASGSHSQK